MNEPRVVSANNVSLAWAEAFLWVMETPDRGRPALLVSVGGFGGNQPIELAEVRDLVDSGLKSLKHNSVSVGDSAFTIFPHNLWQRFRPNRRGLYEYYLKRLLPRLEKRDARNQYGTYFQRMVDFTGQNGDRLRRVNQLEFVIEDWSKARSGGRNRRRSALQVSCFDPAKDHTGQALRGFPCLQQVSFGYTTDERLLVFGYYPVQYVFDRGYGNLLGLCHLGYFVSEAIGLRLGQVTVFVACPELGSKGITKRGLKSLADTLRPMLPVN